MAQFYSTVEDIMKLLPRNLTKNIDENLDDSIVYKTLEETDIEYFMKSADTIIDSAISVLYVTPLVRIIEVNRATNGETVMYPRPIPYTAALLAAYLIFQKAFSEQQSPNQIPKYAESYKDSAMRQLTDMRSGVMELRGQRKLGWRYLRPESKNVNRVPIEWKEIDVSKM